MRLSRLYYQDLKKEDIYLTEYTKYKMTDGLINTECYEILLYRINQKSILHKVLTEGQWVNDTTVFKELNFSRDWRVR